MTYTIVSNQPGYLPESPADQAEWDTLAEAREGLALEIRTTAQSAYPWPDDCPALALVLAQASAAQSGQPVTLLGWSHTIVEVEPTCDDCLPDEMCRDHAIDHFEQMEDRS